MATYGGSNPTLLDVVKRYNDDKLVAIAEVLNTKKGMLSDMVAIEGTDSDGTQANMRSGIPTPTWRLYNQAIQPSTSTVVTVKFTTGMMEAASVVDVDLASKFGDPAGFRASEDVAIIEGMEQEAQRALIYDSEKTNPGRITGIQAYYNSLTAQSGKNVISGGGSGSDNTSIYVMCHGARGVHMIYPKGTTAGLEMKDFGIQLVTDSTGMSGGSLQAYVTRYKMKLGLALPDWRQCARICNIDMSNLMTDSSAADLPKLLTRALLAIENPSAGKMGIYMRRDVLTALDEQCRANVISGGGLTYGNVEGQPIAMWRGVPIRVTDALSATEPTVS